MRRRVAARTLVLLVLVAGVARGGDPGDGVDELLRQARDLKARAHDLWRAGKYGEDVPLLREALALEERAWGTDHPNLEPTITSLALSLHAARQCTEIVPLLDRAVRILEKDGGPHDVRIAGVLRDLASEHVLHRRTGEAREALLRALEILERASEADASLMADVLRMLSTVLTREGRHTEAVATAQRALALREETSGANGPELLHLLVGLAQAHVGSRDYEGALGPLRRALAVGEAAWGPKDAGLDAPLDLLGLSLSALGAHEEASGVLARLVGLREDFLGPKHRRTLLALERRALSLEQLSRFAEAEALIARTLAARREVLGPAHPETLKTRRRLAKVLAETGEYETARAHLEAVLAATEAHGVRQDPRVAEVLDELVDVLVAMGRHEEARPAAERAVAIHEEAGTAESAAGAYAISRLASILARLGRPEEARPLAERALALMEEHSAAFWPGLADVMAQIVLPSADSENPAGGVKALERWTALVQREMGSEHPATAASILTYGAALYEAGMPTEARTQIERSLRMREQVLGPDHPDTATSLAVLAHLLVETGHAREALPLARRAVRIRERVLGTEGPGVAGGLDVLASAHEALEAWPEAQACRLRALAIGEATLRRDFAVLGPEQRRARLRLTRRHLDRWLDVAPKVGRTGYEEVLRLKGFAARASAAEARLAQEGGRTSAALTADLVAAERSLSKLACAFPATRDEAEWARWRAAWAEAAAKRERLAIDLARSFGPYREALGRSDVGLRAIQGALRAGEALVDCLRAGDRYLAWVVPPSGAVHRIELGSAKAIDDAAAAFTTTLAGPGGRGPLVVQSRTARTDPVAAGRRLADLVWRPVARHLPQGTETVILCPDAHLACIPFSALPGEADGAFLGDEVLLVHVPMAQDLAEVAAPPPTADHVLLVGGVAYGAPREEGTYFTDLPGTGQEVSFLKALFGESARVLTGAHATEAELRRQVRGSTIVHLATHGFVREDSRRGLAVAQDTEWLGVGVARQIAAGHDPMVLAGLALAGANSGDGSEGDDGILTALEAARLDLTGTELVVLSACQTAAGRAESGEGVIGLVMAFRMAGAHRVLGSLWKVDDAATRTLMQRFHEALERPGASVPSALRAAQAAVRSAAGWQHPSFWAAWEAWGPLR